LITLKRRAMKIVFTCMLVLLSAGWIRADNFRKLCEVNSCWKQHAGAAVGAPEEDSPRSERDWIAFHLRMVEAALRQNCPASIGAAQHANRLRCLDLLATYTTARAFPANDYRNYSTPVFIDRRNNFCAVGYLLKATGHEALARKVSAWNNFAYVGEMNFPELNAWAQEFGFSTDELAWIQPSYAPSGRLYTIGKGVDGPVMALFADNDENTLYVGGKFSRANDSLAAGNIAFLTSVDSGVYAWHSMGSLAEPVQAIAKYKGKIYAGGTSVHVWDDSAWADAGCLNGDIRELAVLDGVLYAAGRFDICQGNTGVNFARWTDSSWEAIPGLSGRVNTLEVVDNSFVLGGVFSFFNVPVNAIAWSPTVGFWPFGNALVNEANDFSFYHDTLYAATRPTKTGDNLNLLMRLVSGQWETLGRAGWFLTTFSKLNGDYSINTLCDEGRELTVGGSFLCDPPAGSWSKNCFSMFTVLPQGDYYPAFSVDSAINKIVIFQNDLIAGGNFQNAYGTPGLHHIGRRPANHEQPARVSSPVQSRAFTCYPNPAKSGAEITIRHSFDADRYTISDMSGKLVLQGKLAPGPQQKLSSALLSPGNYLLEVQSQSGKTAALRLIIH
jgi:hypothetical protein